MKTKSFLSILILTFFSLTAFAQNTGTLKVFSEEPVIVYVDQVQQPTYDAITLSAGTHYVKVLNKNEERIYNEIVTIVANQVTSVLIETDKAAVPAGNQPVNNPASNPKGTGSVNIFSEFTGISVYLNENKQGTDIKTINAVPAGNHYLKIMKDGVSIFAELITVTAGQTTTVLVKNDGQVAEKIMEGKVKEREEYQAKKIDVLFSTNSVSTTAGSSTLFPGYYGYYGYSKSVTNTQQVADFKIIQGGVKEIFDTQLATSVSNKKILDLYAADNVRYDQTVTTGNIMAIVGAIPFLVFTVDMVIKKPFLHPAQTDPDASTFATIPAWEWTGYIVSGLVTWAGFKISEQPSSNFIKHHYYKVDEAAQDAKKHNDKLKETLGLPESYDVK